MGPGKSALAVLRVARQPNYTALLTGLVNDLAQLPDPTLLVLDEVHVLTSAEVGETLLFFIEHLPPNLHVLALGRSEPGWPVALLRARGELNEIQADDLRFSQAEIAAFLPTELPGSLPANLVQRIEAKTEGWAAGVRLVSLAMQGENQSIEQVIEPSTASTVLSWLTCAKKCLSSSRNQPARSCCEPVSSIGSAARCVIGY